MDVKCKDRECPFHGNLKTHGRIFKGIVVSKHDKRIAVEMERMVYVKKYERYSKKKTKIHARLPRCVDKDVKIGNWVKVKECRPLSKIIHFVFLEKIKNGDEEK
ncbi:MAG: 30S ribosomal protein S17 [Nanoarchaeota archaeon]|nr:30S ribosomal protein S17 [Nanoarchaeota archaeon]